MRVFIFDLLPYAEHLDYLKVDGELPWPLGKRYFKPEVAVQTYAEHLDAWAAMEDYGFDGVAFNEHHGTPYGLMNSPNLLAASIAQRTKKLRLLMYGNLLPLHEPLRLAEELAMLDCLSNGRLESGVVRGAPREYRIYNRPLNESRARFDEAYEIIRKAWTEESFSYEGKFNSYKDVAIWPRPVQQPHPPVWCPVMSKDSIEWAARNNVGITPGGGPGGARSDIIKHYAKVQSEHGRKVTPDKLNIQVTCYVADSKEKAVEEIAPYQMYLFNTLFPFDHGQSMEEIRRTGYFSANAQDHLSQRAAPPRAANFGGGSSGPWGGGMTIDRVRAMAEAGAVGPPELVAEKIIAACEDAGAGTVMLMCNGGAMPQAMFLNQVRRIGREVLPRLKDHQITRVKYAEGVAD
jgi:alkanesulfonate monooxygenase SsuD/methylene tetrahydromethanopterin reductase-like flavin-dependent oxidoreductase (luciferase family)